MFLFLVLTMTVISCGNELDLVAEGANVPIVYSLLSSGQERQYVRVEQAFIDANKPAQEVAQDENAVYYGDDAQIRLVNVTENKSFILQKVNATDLGFIRKDGFFPTDPNYLYVHEGTNTDFNPGQTVRFELDRGDDQDLVFSEIGLLDTILITKPEAETSVSIPDLSDYTIKWVLKGDNAPSAYSIDIIMYYEEANQEDAEPEFVPKQLKWDFADVQDELSAAREGKEFFKFLQESLEEDPKYVRTFEWFDVIIAYTGQEVKRYNDFLSANTGITSSQPIPPFSNLSSGLGLVGARNEQYSRRVFLKPTAKDSLENGRFTKNLGFL